MVVDGKLQITIDGRAAIKPTLLVTGTDALVLLDKQQPYLAKCQTATQVKTKTYILKTTAMSRKL